MGKIASTLNRHFILCMQMIYELIESSPDYLWSYQPENHSVWKRILHILESIDFWMDDFSEYQFISLFDGISAEMDMVNNRTLPKEDLIAYFRQMQIKIEQFFKEVDDCRLTEMSLKHKNVIYLDIVICQIRHIQTNIGYCCEKFITNNLKGIKWIGYNETQ